MPTHQTIVGATITGPAVDDLLLEDGGYVRLEDGSGRILLDIGGGLAQVFAPSLTQFAADQSITTGFITSGSVARTPSIAPGPVTVLAQTRASTAQVFAPSVAPGAVTVLGATVPATGQMFVPSVAVGPVVVTTAFLTSTTQLYPPTLTSIAVGSIGTIHIASTEQLHPPTVSLATFVVTGATIGTTSTLRAPSVAPGPVTVVGATQNSTVVLYAPSVQPGSATIIGVKINSSVQLIAPSVTTVTFVVGATRMTMVQMFAPKVAYVITGATIPVGSVLRPPSVVPPGIITGFIYSTIHLFSPAVSTGATGVTTGTIGSTAHVYPPSLLDVFPPGTCLTSKTSVQYLVTSASVDCMMRATSASVKVRYLGAGVGVTPVSPVTATVKVRYLATSAGVHVCCLETIP